MSVTYVAAVVVGVKLARKTLDVSVTRYNEMTGKPYQKTEQQSSLFYESGKQVGFNVLKLLMPLGCLETPQLHLMLICH